MVPLYPTALIPMGIVRLEILLQPANAAAPIETDVFSMDRVLIDVLSLNALLPMELTVPGMLTVPEIPLHSANMLLPMDTTLSNPIVISCEDPLVYHGVFFTDSFVYPENPFPSFPLVNVKDLRAVQPENTFLE